MGQETKISWCHSTWNLAWGCTKVSPGCANCYAESTSEFRGYDIWGKNKSRRTFGEAHWREPLKWNRQAEEANERRRVFCSSMCDNFEDHPDIKRELAKLWPLIRATPWLDWLLLSKRDERIALSLPDDWGAGYPNAWLGVSIENADYAHRADALRKAPATVRFISYEPALGPLASALNLQGIDWVIYGGESGNGSRDFRPEDKQWARDMRDRCAAEGVAFFHKQSAAVRTEMGTQLDGKDIKEYPKRRLSLPQLVPAGGLF